MRVQGAGLALCKTMYTEGSGGLRCSTVDGRTAWHDYVHEHACAVGCATILHGQHLNCGKPRGSRCGRASGWPGGGARWTLLAARPAPGAPGSMCPWPVSAVRYSGRCVTCYLCAAYRLNRETPISYPGTARAPAVSRLWRLTFSILQITTC